MSALKGVLKEEFERLAQVEKSYKAELAKLPKGSLQRKKIKGISYLYLAFRQKGRVVYKYFGPGKDPGVQEINAKIRLRRRYESELRKVRQHRERLRKIIYGKRGAI